MKERKKSTTYAVVRQEYLQNQTFGWPIGRLVSQTKIVIYSVIVLRDFPTENSIEGNQLIDLGNICV